MSIMQFITSWERKGIEQGRAEEARDTLLNLLQEKFGAVPETTIHCVEAVSSVEELRRLLRQLVHVNSLAEMGLDGTEK